MGADFCATLLHDIAWPFDAISHASSVGMSSRAPSTWSDVVDLRLRTRHDVRAAWSHPHVRGVGASASVTQPPARALVVRTPFVAPDTQRSGLHRGSVCVGGECSMSSAAYSVYPPWMAAPSACPRRPGAPPRRSATSRCCTPRSLSPLPTQQGT
jgi:hypothetical protein